MKDIYANCKKTEHTSPAKKLIKRDFQENISQNENNGRISNRSKIFAKKFDNQSDISDNCNNKNVEDDIDIYKKTVETREYTSSKLEKKFNELKKFQEDLFERVNDRMTEQKEKEQKQRIALKEKQKRLLLSRNEVIKEKENQSHGKNSPQKFVYQSTINVLTPRHKRSTPFQAQLNETNILCGEMRNSLLKHKRMAPGDDIDAIRLQDEAQKEILSPPKMIPYSRKLNSKKDHELLGSLSNKERAEMLVFIRRSYMEIERKRVQKSLQRKRERQRLINHKSNSNKESVLSIIAVSTQDRGLKIIDVTGHEFDVNDENGEFKPSQGGKETLKKTRQRLLGRNRKLSTQSNTQGKQKAKDKARYLTALKKNIGDDTLCICSANKQSSTLDKNSWDQCANNCSLYKNPKQVEQLVHSMYQSSSLNRSSSRSSLNKSKMGED